IWGLFWPTQGRKWPQRRGEPGIKNIWVLLIAFRCGFIWAKTDDVLVALCILWSVPNWNAVAPPQLTGNGTVMHIVHPLEEACFLSLWVNSGITCTNSIS